MPLAALLAVLLAACTHASWNLVAKTAARSRHFVWLYSIASLLIWTGPAIWVLMHTHWHPGPQPWLALVATALLHLAYSLALQSGYSAGDLSLVYPIARGTGPLLSFAGAALLLGERPGWIPPIGVLLVASGIALVAEVWRRRRQSPRAGILWGLLTGACIASYTLNDGWAVKYLAISPILVDFTGNLFRAIVLARPALTNVTRMRQEVRDLAVQPWCRRARTLGLWLVGSCVTVPVKPEFQSLESKPRLHDRGHALRNRVPQRRLPELHAGVRAPGDQDLHRFAPPYRGYKSVAHQD